ncbi:MAG TPA: hypothetical protein VFR41_04015 [Acidimicrobiia bacterium]|nr:hypothetical protein [Acidimicrobiia bacterium]
MAELTDSLDQLTKRVEQLEARNAELEATLAERPPSETASERFNRRRLLRLGGVAAAAGAGAVLMRPGVAGAAQGNMQFGADNAAVTDGTGLSSSNGTDTLHVTNTGTGEVVNATQSNAANTTQALHGVNDGTDVNCAGVWGEITDAASEGVGVVGTGYDGAGVLGSSAGIGPGVWAVAGNSNALYALSLDPNLDPSIEAYQGGTGMAIYGHVENALGTKPAVEGRTIGTGNGVYGAIANTASKGSATKGATTGKGAGIEGASSLGVGGKFSGKAGQLYLVPGSGSTHPTSSAAGVFYVDHSGRLWYCRGGTTWKQLA